MKNSIEDFKKSISYSISNLKVKVINKSEEFRKGEMGTISVKVTNKTKKDNEICIIAGLFDSNNKFIKYSQINQVVEAGEDIILASNIKIPNKEKVKMKVFIWNSLKNMKPLCNVIEINIK